MIGLSSCGDSVELGCKSEECRVKYTEAVSLDHIVVQIQLDTTADSTTLVLSLVVTYIMCSVILAVDQYRSLAYGLAG